MKSFAVWKPRHNLAAPLSETQYFGICHQQHQNKNIQNLHTKYRFGGRHLAQMLSHGQIFLHKITIVFVILLVQENIWPQESVCKCCWIMNAFSNKKMMTMISSSNWMICSGDNGHRPPFQVQASTFSSTSESNCKQAQSEVLRSTYLGITSLPSKCKQAHSEVLQSTYLGITSPLSVCTPHWTAKLLLLIAIFVILYSNLASGLWASAAGLILTTYKIHRCRLAWKLHLQQYEIQSAWKWPSKYENESRSNKVWQRGIVHAQPHSKKHLWSKTWSHTNWKLVHV